MPSKKKDPTAATDADLESMTGPVDEAVAEINEHGFMGQKVDPLPNEAYSFQGQVESPERTAHVAPDARRAEE